MQLFVEMNRKKLANLKRFRISVSAADDRSDVNWDQQILLLSQLLCVQSDYHPRSPYAKCCRGRLAKTEVS